MTELKDALDYIKHTLNREDMKMILYPLDQSIADSKTDDLIVELTKLGYKTYAVSDTILKIVK